MTLCVCVCVRLSARVCVTCCCHWTIGLLSPSLNNCWLELRQKFSHSPPALKRHLSPVFQMSVKKRWRILTLTSARPPCPVPTLCGHVWKSCQERVNSGLRTLRISPQWRICVCSLVVFPCVINAPRFVSLALMSDHQDTWMATAVNCRQCMSPKPNTTGCVICFCQTICRTSRKYCLSKSCWFFDFFSSGSDTCPTHSQVETHTLIGSEWHQVRCCAGSETQCTHFWSDSQVTGGGSQCYHSIRVGVNTVSLEFWMASLITIYRRLRKFDELPGRISQHFHKVMYSKPVCCTSLDGMFVCLLCIMFIDLICACFCRLF